MFYICSSIPYLLLYRKMDMEKIGKHIFFAEHVRNVKRWLG